MTYSSPSFPTQDARPLIAAPLGEAVVGRELLDPTTGHTIFDVAPTDAATVAALVERARTAAPAWAATPLAARGRALAAAADALARDATLPDLMVSDVGKPRTEAAGEWQRAVAILRYAAGLAQAPVGELYEDSAGQPIRVQRAPRGTVGLITPWNFPLAIPTWKLAPALLAGNAVLLKPAGQGARLAASLVAALHAGGVPADVLTLVPGGAATAQALIAAQLDAISFTGSTGVGRDVVARAAALLVPAQAELGGKNVVFVSASADPDAAARILLAGAMGYAGQKCTATGLALVAEPAYEAVAAALREQVGTLRALDPRDERAVLGPLIDVASRDRVQGELEQARSRGVELLGEGAIDAACTAAGLAPTVVGGGAEDDELYREETFGPVLGVQPVADLDAALVRMQALEQGLAAGIVSPLAAEVQRFASDAPAGVVRVNAPTTGLEPHVAFGGIKGSSYGPPEQGKAGVEFFSVTRTIYGA
jgi:alpha-ketoglutaric semialdehyde dehydrogenase